MAVVIGYGKGTNGARLWMR